MKATFERAKRAVKLFNQNQTLIHGESEIFFAHAVEMICAEDGLRISDVLSKHGYKIVVLELADTMRKPHRLLALWSEGRGQVQFADEVSPRFQSCLAFEPEGHSAYPAGIATFMSPELEDELTGASPAPVTVPTLVEPAVRLQPASLSKVPESDLSLSYRVAHVFRRLVPRTPIAFNLLVHMELMVSQANERKVAFISGDVGMDMLRGGEFPRDTLNILEHQMQDMLKLRGIEDLEMVLDNPKLIPLAV